MGIGLISSMGIPRTSAEVFSREYLAVFFLSISALCLEISLTRLLSYLEWYHFAFMVVSIALFGYGASGALLSVFPGIRRNQKTVPISAGLCAIILVSTLLFVSLLRFDPIRAHTRPLHLLVIPLQYVSLGLPFFLVGTCLASLVTRRPERANFYYFSDLTGAGTGAVLALGIMPLGGPHIAIFVSASLAAFACFLLSVERGMRGVGKLALAGSVIFLLMPVGLTGFNPEISEYKGLSAALRFPDAQIIWSGWNSISRIDVVNSSFIHHAPGMSFDEPRPIPEQLGLLVDGDNLEPITRFDGNLSTLGFMESLPGTVPYEMLPRERVLVLDSGGGFEVLQALAMGAGEIEATEQNSAIVKLMKRNFDSFSGNLFTGEEVVLHTTDARSFLSRTDRKYDLIEIALKQDPISASAGLYSLSESYLLTVEGFASIFDRLSENGVLSVTRWISPPPRQAPRTWVMMVEVLEGDGIQDPSSHMVSFRTYLTITTLLKRTPFVNEEIEELKEICRVLHFDLVHYPGMAESEANRYNRFEEPLYYSAFKRIFDPEDREDYLEGSFFRLDAATDEKPFFNDFLKLERVPDLRDALGRVWNPYLEGGLLVLAVLVQAIGLSAIFVLVPGILKRSRQRVHGKAWWLGFFLALGAAYILIEVALLQKMILFLGQPAFAMAAVLSGMLVFSGVGGLWTTRFKPGRGLVVRAVTGIVILLVTLFVFLGPIFNTFLGLHVWIKFPLSIILVAPLAFLMGIPFPIGLRLLGIANPEAIPLAYAANGCSSVIGSAATIIVASWLGYSSVLLLGALVYVASIVALPGSRC